MHNINNNNDDLWPQKGEWLRYIMTTTDPDYYMFEPKLSHNNEYRVEDIRFVPCADAIKIIDDNEMLFWVPLYKFSFIGQLELYND